MNEKEAVEKNLKLEPSRWEAARKTAAGSPDKGRAERERASQSSTVKAET
jgi:hypothetical protein